MNGIYIVVGLMIILLIIVISDLKIKVIVLKDDQQEEIALTIYALYGLIKYRLALPFIKLLRDKNLLDSLNLNTDIKVGQQKLVKDKQEEDLNFSEVKELYQKGIRFYKRYNQSIQYIHSHIIINEIAWYTEVGLEDAAITAISTGFFWMIKSNLLVLLNKNFNAKEIHVNVIPYYGGYKFHTSLNCIITLKLGHIIIAGYKIIIRKLKGW